MSINSAVNGHSNDMNSVKNKIEDDDPGDLCYARSNTSSSGKIWSSVEIKVDPDNAKVCHGQIADSEENG